MADESIRTGKASGRTATGRTRRQLLAGGTGALAAVLAAEALARPAPAHAADGDPVILGANNDATTATFISNTGSATVLVCAANGGADGVIAGTGSGNGLHGISNSGIGVFGESTSGTGVVGSSDTGTGVFAASNSALASGLLAHNTGGGEAVTATISTNVAAIHGGSTGSGIGVQGDSADGFGVAGHSNTHYGVIGDTDAATASGVWGTNQAGGQGVLGSSTGASGIGVMGQCAAGTGVSGQAASATGIGVLAANTGGGHALAVSGTAAFTNSGLLTVAAGKSSATQTGVPLSKASLVLATMQQDRTGVVIRSAVPNVAGQSVTVHLSKAVTAATTVAWFIVDTLIM